MKINSNRYLSVGFNQRQQQYSGSG